jgi:hypothetical protein
MDCQAMACAAWSRDGRLVNRISLGHRLVDRICSVLEKVIPPLRHAGPQAWQVNRGLQIGQPHFVGPSIASDLNRMPASIVGGNCRELTRLPSDSDCPKQTA